MILLLALGLIAPRVAVAAGPWTGRIVDGYTGAALDGVVVVATWNRRAHGHPAIGLGTPGLVAVEEVVTDATGGFVLAARALVNPPLFFPIEGPDLMIFKSGYGGWRFRGAPEDLTTQGGIIEMRPLTTLDERLKYIDGNMSERDARWGSLKEGRGSERARELPTAQIPRYEAALNEERLLLGRTPQSAGYPYVGVEEVGRRGMLRPVVPGVPGGGVTFVTKWGDGNPKGPGAVAVNRRTQDLYAVDQDLPGVRRFDRRGTLLGTWGGAGTEPGRFRGPDGIAVDADGNVYVADSYNHRMQKFAADGSFLLKWSAAGRSQGIPWEPRGVATDAQGYIWVSEGLSRRLQKFSSTGGLVASLDDPVRGGTFASTAVAVARTGEVYAAHGSIVDVYGPAGDVVRSLDFSAPGQSVGVVGSNPAGLAVDDRGTLYVADGLHDRVLTFDPAGRRTRVWGGKGTRPGTFQMPRNSVGLAVLGDTVYVSDEGNHRVQRFSRDGAWLGQLTDFPGARTLGLPKGLAVGSNRTIYVADTEAHRIVRFSPDGELLGAWGFLGREPGQFQWPEGVAVAPDGSVYVADRGNSRVQVFDPTGRFLREWGRPNEPPRDQSGLRSPHDIAIGRDGDVFVLARSKIYRFTTAGTLRAEWSFKGSGIHLTVDGNGHVYVTSTAQSEYPPPPNSYSLFKWDADGRLLADWRHERFPNGVAVDARGEIYVTETGNAKDGTRASKFDAQHNLLLSWALGDSSGVSPGGVALDGAGHAFVIYGNAIMKYALPPAP